jgi:hypothetical protein
MSAAEIALAPSPSLRTPRMGAVKILFIWIALTLVAFPIAGLLGWTISGHVDAVVPALVGGALTGAGVGFAQWLLLRRDLGVGPVWILATAGALATGLSVGAAVVGYETSAGSLAVMGAISGAAVGFAQGLLLRNRFSLWAEWMIAMPVLWAVAWVVTESAGINVSNQFTVFGASGAVVFGIMSGLLLMVGKRSQDDASPAPASS